MARNLSHSANPSTSARRAMDVASAAMRLAFATRRSSMSSIRLLVSAARHRARQSMGVHSGVPTPRHSPGNSSRQLHSSPPGQTAAIVSLSASGRSHLGHRSVTWHLVCFRGSSSY